MKKTAQFLLSAIFALGVVAAPLAASANPHYPDHMRWHPRRDQVNWRLDHQNWRIRQGVRNGTLTRQQAHQLHAEDRSIHAQEWADVKANGGYITKQQQRALNQEENAASQQIYSEKH
jgi:transposase